MSYSATLLSSEKDYTLKNKSNNKSYNTHTNFDMKKMLNDITQKTMSLSFLNTPNNIIGGSKKDISDASTISLDNQSISYATTIGSTSDSASDDSILPPSNKTKSRLQSDSIFIQSNSRSPSYTTSEESILSPSNKSKKESFFIITTDNILSQIGSRAKKQLSKEVFYNDETDLSISDDDDSSQDFDQTGGKKKPVQVEIVTHSISSDN